MLTGILLDEMRSQMQKDTRPRISDAVSDYAKYFTEEWAKHCLYCFYQASLHCIISTRP